MTRKKKKWNQVLADAIAHGEIDMFEGLPITKRSHDYGEVQQEYVRIDGMWSVLRSAIVKRLSDETK